MKKNLLLFIILIICGTSFFAQVPSYVPTNGLVGWWPFNGNANDESVNGNNGTVNGATLTTDRFGNANKAYSFDGVDDFISSNPTLPNGSAARTVSCWFNTTAGSIPTSQYPDLQAITGWGNPFGGAVIFPQFVKAPAGNAYFESGSSGNQLYSQSAVNDGFWHQILTTYNGAGSRVKLYIDGIIQDSTGLITLNTASSYFGIGNISWANVPFLGQIDDVGIWNRALTDCEIQDLYNAQLNSAIGIIAGIDQTVCEGDPVTLTGTGGSNYQWNNGVTDGQSFTATASQEYIVIGEDANGCIGTDTTHVIVNSHTTATQTETALDSYTWPVNGQSYTQSGTYTAVIPNAAGCDSTITLDLTLNFTGIDEKENSKTLISPNPVSDYFVVSASEELMGEAYSIIDLNGKTLKKGTLTQKEQKIEIGNLSEGMYLFKINHATEQTFRIIKN
ncbi:MAG: Internalin-J precursor [Bacteroidota bacterium]|jgi:hypothetical protein